MPVHVEPRGGRYCVVEPDGSVIHCHDREDDAVAQMQAINISLSEKETTTVRGILESRIHESFTVAADKLFGLGYIDRDQRIALSSLISDVLTMFGESIDEEVANASVGGEDAMHVVKDTFDTETVVSTSNDRYTNTTTSTWSPVYTTDSTDANTNKDVYYAVPFTPFAPKSFEELDKAAEIKQENERVSVVLDDFSTLAENILADPAENKTSLLRKLANELLAKLGVGGDEDEEEDEDGLLDAVGIMMPAGDEEDEEDELKEVWSAAYMNDLPDSAFLFVESGGEKDSEGKTTPRTLRHLPYKDKNGKVDVPHVRNAINRAGQIKLQDGKKIGAAKAEELKNRARKILASATKSGGLFIWKQADGTWRWFGVYSNKYRDDDYPVKEIISEKAHTEFIDRVRKGDLSYPDLYVWHIPVPVGKADLLAYDNSGFSVVSGTFTKERVAKALSNTTEDLAMSHGMPTEHILRAKDDPTVITRYISTEVSVLPRYAAANKMTDFRIIPKGDKNMSFPDEQREDVVRLLGEEATSEIEEALAAKAKIAEEKNIEWKEQQQVEAQPVAEPAPEPVVEPVVEPEQQPVVEAEPEPQAEPEAEPEPVIDEAVEKEQPAEPAPAGEQADAGEQALRDELVAVLTEFTKSIDQRLSVFDDVTKRINALEETLTKLERSEDEKLAEKAAGMPTASLAAALQRALSGSPQAAESVIGNPATHVHGNSKLAKEKPVETAGEPESKGGLFFKAQGWTN